VDRRFIWRYLGFDPVNQLVRRLHRRLLNWYHRFIRRCLFFSFSCSVLTLVFLTLACGFLAFLGPRSVYKDMLKIWLVPMIMLSLITKIKLELSGIWGQVRYILCLRICSPKPTYSRGIEILPSSWTKLGLQQKSFNWRPNLEFKGSWSSTKMHKTTINDPHQKIWTQRPQHRRNKTHTKMQRK
jgi:hypothetical protein